MMGRLQKATFLMHARRLLLDVALAGAALCMATIVPIIGAYGVGSLLRTPELSLDLLGFMAAAAISFAYCRTYRMVWRYVSFRDLFKLMQGVTLTVLIYLVGITIWLQFREPPIAMSGILVAWAAALIWSVSLAFLVAPRLIARLWTERRFGMRLHNKSVIASDASPRSRRLKTILLVGDAHRMAAFIREAGQRAEKVYNVAGVFSDDPSLLGGKLNGVDVLGPTSAIPNMLRALEARGVHLSHLVLADDYADQEVLEKLLDDVAGMDVQVGRLPPLNSFNESRTSVRSVALSDLLGRQEISCDTEAAESLIAGRCVMVTGAGGSIGSELCRQVSQLNPSKVILLDNSEYNLYKIDQELLENFSSIRRVMALADVRDAGVISNCIKAHKPDIVFHAAALKHVPLMEENPIEAVKTNVIGTSNVANACRTNGVKFMVTISTDKAVNPHNIMGATKRLAEAYCQGLDQVGQGGQATRFMTVRFGNVLGSAGSVVPLFSHQIETGGPVTVTDPDVTRYFMTIPEAVSLVLQAGALGAKNQQERSHIYVLDMGAPIKIIDLARQMIRLSGHRPDDDIKVKFIGMRPGEKLYEEVVHSDEAVEATEEAAVNKVTPRFTDLHIVSQQIQEFKMACEAGDRERVLRLIKLAVPEYVADEPAIPSEVGADSGAVV